MDGRRSLREVVDEVEKVMDTQGLEAVCESRSSVANMARPRRQEIFACLDRYRVWSFRDGNRLDNHRNKDIMDS